MNGRFALMLEGKRITYYESSDDFVAAKICSHDTNFNATKDFLVCLNASVQNESDSDESPKLVLQ
jgi:hypothetical protein